MLLGAPDAANRGEALGQQADGMQAGGVGRLGRIAPFLLGPACACAVSAAAPRRFGDFTREEFLALMLPKAARRQEQQQQQLQQEERRQLSRHDRRQLARHELAYEPLADASRLPRTVTWRGTGADRICVKDQANCGSCWWVRRCWWVLVGAGGAWWMLAGAAGCPPSGQASRASACSCST